RRNSEELARYQDSRYAKQYTDFVDQVRRVEERLDPQSSVLTQAVADQYYRLLAYKDEYEVARLYSAPEFKRAIERQFEGDYKLSFHLSPPILAPRAAVTGEPRKYRFGSWMLLGFHVLARLRFLRGTPFDPFGWTQERRQERALSREYRAELLA